MAALSWSTARTNLLAWAGADYGAGALPAVWRDTQGDSSYAGRRRVVLDLVSLVTMGKDEVRYANVSNPPAGGELSVTVTGQRTITLEVSVESQDQRAGLDSIAFMSLLRTSFQRPTVVASFKACGLAFNAILSERELRQEAIYQRRRYSAVQMDVLLNASVEMADAAATYIETMRYETEFLGPDGLPIAHQLSGDLDLIP